MSIRPEHLFEDIIDLGHKYKALEEKFDTLETRLMRRVAALEQENKLIRAGMETEHNKVRDLEDRISGLLKRLVGQNE